MGVLRWSCPRARKDLDVPTTAAMNRAEELIGYTFRDRVLLEAALTHASFADHRLESNERLEFFGDAVLGMVICEELYKRFPELLEGELTKIKSSVVSRRTCALVVHDRGLEECLLLGKGMADQESLPGSMMAAVYESLVGAMYFDGGYDVVRTFILRDMGRYIDEAAESENQQNYKSHLQHYAQKHLNSTPAYELLDEKGPDHNKCFEISVSVGGKRYPSAWGPSKKEAEQKAALNALQELHVLAEPDATNP